MIRFILNNKDIVFEGAPGTLLLDYIRYREHLHGTKIGCREGDCGACTILLGEFKQSKLVYQSATSCLTAMGNVGGKHVVTIEGVNLKGLNFLQESFAEEGASQCGFCTPGFIVSLTGYCLQETDPSFVRGIDAVNGNICRCTGYKSIERAIQRVTNKLGERNGMNAIEYAISVNILPAYFSGIAQRLNDINGDISFSTPTQETCKNLGGGTDLYVQQHDSMTHADIRFLSQETGLKGILIEGPYCRIGANTTVSAIMESEIMQTNFPRLEQYMRLVSSTPIRNIATIAGNFVNASPIGDLTIFFLALDAQLILTNGKSRRTVALRSFYQGYKKIDLLADEIVEEVFFKCQTARSYFHFEKVSKRTHLDIASVNTAIHLIVQDQIIVEAGLSAGGVGPVPMYLSASSALLVNQPLQIETINQLMNVVSEEISPISDARGTAEYKRLLLNQLIKAHFITLFPEIFSETLMPV